MEAYQAYYNANDQSNNSHSYLHSNTGPIPTTNNQTNIVNNFLQINYGDN